MHIKTALVAALFAGLATGAAAQDFQPKAKGDWLINTRLSVVAPDAGDPILTAAGASTGLSAEVSDDVMPTLGISYFMTDKVAVELVLGTTKHTVKAKGAAGSTKVHETWVLPPIVAVQYHPAPEARVSPYVGVGVNYMLFYSGEDKNGFDVDLDDGLGLVLQGGVDVALQGPWSLNADVKKVFFNTDATVNNGALKADVDLDPWVVSVGLGRKF